MGRIVIVAYKPKSGKAEELKELTKTHVPRLKREGLVTDREAVIMEASDGTIVEVFEWLSDEAIQNAHTNVAVLQMWNEYFALCDIIPLDNLSEAKTMFAGFKPVD
jgi:GTP:adenosylcobinamide-phosphate guanylyltransferase